MEPSRFYRQHHAVEAPAIDAVEFRPFFRVRPKLEQLLLDRAISIIEYRAGQRFRALAEIVLAGDWPNAQWLDKTRVNGRGGLDLAISRRVDALNRLDAIRRALGPVGFALLEAHLVDDLTWRAIGARYRRDPKTVRAWTIVALRALAAVMWA